MVVLGLDVGTGSAKAVAFEAAQGILGRGSAGYETHKPQPGWAEQDPEDWWAAAARAIRAALQAAERSASDVTSLAISAMGGATVALDGSGDPVQPALVNLDRRATEELRALASAETVTEGANGVVFLPYLAGELHPINDPDARGVFTGLSIDTTPADLARAVIEGSANAIAHNLSTITEVTHLPDVLRVTGRPASSAAWCRSIADATAVPVETVTDDGAPLGDALLAAASSEAEVRELASIHAVVHEDYVPRAEHTAAARERHALAQRLYAASSARPDVRSASCRC